MKETLRLLRQIQADKLRFGTHPCCAMLITGPHSMDCPETHDMVAYYTWPNLEDT